MALYQKYRSKKFSDLIGQDHINKTLLEAIKSGKLAHAYLMTGPRGTGKTSTARLLAKAFNCLNIGKDGEPCNECEMCKEVMEGRAVDVIEIDAASHTSVEDIREIIDKVRFAPNKAKKKVYIIDEVHMLSKSAFNALLKTLEEPPAHVVFILATTEVQKLPETILSRTQRYDFHRVTKKDIIKNLTNIAKSEGIEINPEALDLIAARAEGSHRDSISLFEQVASFSNEISKADVENILGVATSSELFVFLEAIFNKIPEEGLKIAQRFFEEGIEMTELNKAVIEVLRKMLLFKVSGQILFEETDDNILAIKKMAQNLSEEQVVDAINIFMKAGKMLKDIAYPILPIEMAVVELCLNSSSKLEAQSSKQAQNSNIQTSKPAGATLKPEAEVGPVKNVIPTEVEGSFDKLRTGSSNQKISPTVQKSSQGRNDSTAEQPAGHSANKSREIEDIAANSSVPVEVLQMTDNLWEKVIDSIKVQNSTLAALLRDAKPISMSGEKITIGAKFKFHKDKISEQKNREIIENAINELTGSKYILLCELIEGKAKKQAANSKESVDLGKAAEEIFG